MRFQTAQEALSAGIGAAQRAVSTRTTIPALTGILVEADAPTSGGSPGVRLSATDHEIGIQAFIPADVAVAGAVVLPARIFGELVRKVPPQDITVDVDPQNHTATLAWGRSHFTIHGYAADQYPLLPPFDGDGGFVVDQDALKNLFRRAHFAVSHDETRPQLTGALFLAEAQGLRLVATDGFRMAVAAIPVAEGPGDPVEVILPGRALAELGRLAGSEGQAARVRIAENQVFFDLGGVRFLSRVVDGPFPNWQAVIPKEFKGATVVDTRAFLDACERAALLAREGPAVVRLGLQPEALVVTANTPEVGKGYEELAAAGEGEAAEIAFNARFLIEGLRAVDAESVRFDISGPVNPCRLAGVDDDGYLYIVLPVRSV